MSYCGPIRQVPRNKISTVTLYGIRGCDRCRQARRWFADHAIEHRFHDLREDGLNAELLESWLAAVSPARLVNTRSTTWRSLAPESREQAMSLAGIPLLLELPTLIKRPVVTSGQQVRVGYDEAEWTRLLKG